MPTTTDLQMLADILSEQGFKAEIVDFGQGRIIKVATNTGYQIARIHEDFDVYSAQTNGHKMQVYQDVVETVNNYKEYLKIA